MQKVLILDANQRSALAATRSLGSKGLCVVAADETKRTLAGSSRYCKETFVYPSPHEYPEEFLRTLIEESRQRRVQVVFPMTEISAYLVLKHRDELKGLSIPLPSFEAFERLTDKWKLFELSQRLHITMPRTHFIKSGGDLDTVCAEVTFPAVLKPFRSQIFTEERWISASVHYARSLLELKETIAHYEYFKRYPFLIQEYIHGQGQGIFALYDQGKPVTFFAHKRLREKPPSGGVSVLCESVDLAPSLRESAQKILDGVKWHGVAMVEFKVSPKGIPYLMEVNARFWGSLQLAISAGIDFPYLLYKLAVGEKPEGTKNYRVGVKSRWLLGDLDHLYLTLRNRSPQGASFASKLRAIAQFLNFFGKNTHYEINRWDDLTPFLFELKQYLRL
jgi:predicted ATP-grasp superfamily ATP-dependent carboligase